MGTCCVKSGRLEEKLNEVCSLPMSAQIGTTPLQLIQTPMDDSNEEATFLAMAQKMVPPTPDVGFVV